MKITAPLLLILLLGFSLITLADEGDTLIIQTIDYNTPVNPGWNAPRSGIYEFPSESQSFSKILMYYKLKCDPSQSPACGEWDYTTHTRVLEHTGVYDSNLYHHPNYMVNNQSPDSFMVMHEPSFTYEAFLEYFNETSPTIEAEIGMGGSFANLPFDDEAADGRGQFLYQATELLASGLQAGQLTGIKLNINSGTAEFKHFKVQLKSTTANTIIQDSLYQKGFTQVYERNTNFDPSNNYVPFAFPFDWDGSSNIIVDISYADHDGSISIENDQLANAHGLVSDEPNSFLDFEGWDFLTVPKAAVQDLDSAITVSFWQYGNPLIQPINSSIFEAMDSLGNRILNVHLPWSNGGIYWDAGWDDGYDRIDKSSISPSDYKGQWNHWAFTKDLHTGYMQIYLNGNLWALGSGRYRPMNNIHEFRIGAGLTYTAYYAGMVDEFRIWDKAMTENQIREWMYKDVTSDHPEYGHLLAYYQMNEMEGLVATDASPHGQHANHFGYPAWDTYRGENRLRNGNQQLERPHLVFENGTYDPNQLDSLVVVDTTKKGQVSILIFDPDNPTQSIDTLSKWPAYYDNYQYDQAGHAIDSTLVTPDSILYREDYPYYGTPYEVIKPWEIARFITPYGNGLDLGDGFTWVYDVTDYAPLLRDSVHLTAGNFQELLDLKFYMIEGTPPRDVLQIDKVFSGHFSLPNLPAVVPPKTMGLHPDAVNYRLRARTSGHLFDNATNCAEFCPKMHSLWVEGNLVKEWQILQECAENPLYPQGGTWIYDRAGWCPGDKVAEQEVEITPFIQSDSVIIDYESEADPYGSYSLEVQLFQYGPIHHQFDVAIDEIIAPNRLKRYGRFNPTTSAPIIVIQNRGADTLTTCQIQYGPQGSSKTMSWEGSLAFMDKAEVVLEAFNWPEWSAGNGVFEATVSEPNGATDEYPTNNQFVSYYDNASIYPSTFIIKFKTNKVAHQNSYEIRSNTGELIFEKDGFENETIYRDTIHLAGGCYDFYLFDSGDNGISFWANSQGSGYLKFYDIEGNFLESFNGDFGDRIYKSFFADVNLSHNDYYAGGLSFDILPNPNPGRFKLSYHAQKEGFYTIHIINIHGQTVWQSENYLDAQGSIDINIQDYPSGIYTCILESENINVKRKFIIHQ